ncbi:MAG: 6-carboxytetrahydropterin synthase [Bacteroidales bacterium]|nr:6-carboxytetrahydropterin synthase [Bacteroidales bacterium]
MKIRVTKVFNFEMAHALQGYDGLCSNIHGHSYELSVTIKGSPEENTASPKLGMVMDFSVLKKIINDSIISKFDHTLVVKKGSLNIEDLKSKNAMFNRFIEFDFQPTSENLLIYFADEIRKILPKSLMLFSLKLRETNSSFAEWYAEDNI